MDVSAITPLEAHGSWSVARKPPFPTGRSISTVRSRPWRAPIALLGVPIDPVTTVEATHLIEQMLRSDRPQYLVTANVDFLVQARQDVELRRILFDADLVLCDGTPLVWASKWLGNELPERVAGSDLVPLLMEVAEKHGHRIFLLGGAPEATEQAVQRLQDRHPHLIIAGHYSPPFQQLLAMDHEAIRQQIREARPDLLLVSFGCPKQEKWISMNYRTLGVPVSIGVGGTIDFLAGRLPRAPLWMRRIGIEWLFRLAQEPRRLAHRYARDFCLFGFLLVQQWLGTRRRGRRQWPLSPAERQARDGWDEIRCPEWLDSEAVRDPDGVHSMRPTDRPCLLDLQRVKFIDSSGVGWLIRMRKLAQSQGQPLILLAPSPAVERVLDLMKLRSFFGVTRSLAEAETLLRSEPSPSARPKMGDGQESILVWRGEVTAASAPEVGKETERFLTGHSARGRSVTVDLAEVCFIDSTGLGLMVRLKKRATQQGARLQFAGAGPEVRNVIRLARLDAHLLGET